MRLNNNTIDENRIHDVLSCISDGKPIERGMGISTALIKYAIDYIYDNKNSHIAFITSHNIHWHVGQCEHMLNILNINYTRKHANILFIFEGEKERANYIGSITFNKNAVSKSKLNQQMDREAIIIRPRNQKVYMYDLSNYRLYKGIRAWFN